MPTEQAMEAARGMIRHIKDGPWIPVETVAAHLDRVDAVVREVDKRLDAAGYSADSHTRSELRTLLIPEPKPDPVKVLAEATGLSPYLADIALDRLHAAGGRIVFGEDRDV